MEEEKVTSGNDTVSYRLVVGGLVVVLGGIVAAYIALPVMGSQTPTELAQMASAIIGGLVGILTPIKR